MGDIRFATIGTSAICEQFIAAMDDVAGARLVGCYSRDGEKARAFAQKHGAQLAFSSLAELGACEQVDAVYIASPNALHAGQALELIAAGKHVLVEKSFASNEAEAARVFDAAREQGVVALEAMRNLHVPTFRAIHDEVPRLGEVSFATFSFAKVTSRIAQLKAGEKVNIFDPAMSAGALMDMGVYTVAPAVALFGVPDEVRAMGRTVAVPGSAEGDPYGRIDLSGSMLLGYNDKVVTLFWGKTADDKLSCEIAGDAGTLVFDQVSCPSRPRVYDHEDKGMVFRMEAGQARALDCDEPPARDMACEIELFVRAVAGDARALADVAGFEQVTRATLHVMDEARRQMGIAFPADHA